MNAIYRSAEPVLLNPQHEHAHTHTDLVSLVATNTTGFGASPWLTFCRLMTDWELLLMPEVYGLPLAGYGMPVACTAAAEGGTMLRRELAKQKHKHTHI